MKGRVPVEDPVRGAPRKGDRLRRIEVEDEALREVRPSRITLARPRSMAEEFAAMPAGERARKLGELTPHEAERILYEWQFWARDNQKRPRDLANGILFGWLILSGRGFGKTKTGAETVREWKNEWHADGAHPTEHLRIALVAETASEARDVMVRGESGILACSPPWDYPTYVPSRRLLQWPCGCMAQTYSGEEPDQLRGPQFHKAWVDELAKYKYPEDTWDNLEFGLRLGEHPQVVVTTTPKPIKIIRDMVADEQFHVTTGSSYENIANLAPNFIKRVIKKYEGTRTGRQELHAEILDDVKGALWTRARLEGNRVRPSEAPEMVRIVVAIDPAVTNENESDETGIVVAGLGSDGLGYFWRDISGQFSPDGWARRAVEAFDKYEGDRIIAEANNGGDLVEATIRTVRRTIPFKKIIASRGKHVRAEPIAALMEQGRIKHVGQFADVEDQLVNFTPDGYIGTGSPDRADAYVWAFTELMLKTQGEFDAREWEVVNG